MAGSFLNNVVTQDFTICSNCATPRDQSPVFRAGPLGPRSLCNACGIHYRKTGALRRVDKLNNCGRSAKRRCLDIARQQTFLSEGVLPAQESPTISETHSASSNRDPSPAFFSTPLKDNAIATTNQKLSQGMAILQKIESKSESFTLPFDVSQHWLTNDTTEFDELHFEDLEAIADLFDAIDDPFDEFLRQLES